MKQWSEVSNFKRHISILWYKA